MLGDSLPGLQPATHGAWCGYHAWILNHEQQRDEDTAEQPAELEHGAELCSSCVTKVPKSFWCDVPASCKSIRLSFTRHVPCFNHVAAAGGACQCGQLEIRQKREAQRF